MLLDYDFFFSLLVFIVMQRYWSTVSPVLTDALTIYLEDMLNFNFILKKGFQMWDENKRENISVSKQIKLLGDLLFLLIS